MEPTAARAVREQARYDAGLQRDAFKRAFKRSQPDRARRRAVLAEQLQYANGRRALELGSHSWISWIEEAGIRPRELECVNISEQELRKGIEASRTSRVKPRFSLMDAHHLEFADASFDLVFGGAILHHLDLPQALNEIERVLKPDGRILFAEPLGANPVGKLIRLLTPQARTVDEQPLRAREIAEIRRRFDVTLFYEQFLTIPASVISSLVSSGQNSVLTRLAYTVDRWIERWVPALCILYRHVILAGRKRAPGGD